jgi:AhpD family alkylhydroperoxidase
MKPRLNPYQAAPAAMKAMAALDDRIGKSGLDQSLVALVRIRVSQINGCAFCLHQYAREACAQDESGDRIYLLDAWRDSSLYSDRERAALAWAEVVTMLAPGHVPDAVYEEARGQFSEEALVQLTLLVTTVNAWNRFAISFRSVHPVRRHQISPAA